MKQELKNLLSQFKPKIKHSDNYWKFYCRVGSKWDVVTIQEYQADLHGHSSLRGSFSLLQDSARARGFGSSDFSVEDDLPIILKSLKAIRDHQRQSPLEYFLNLNRNFPIQYRTGVIERHHVDRILGDWQDIRTQLSVEEITYATDRKHFMKEQLEKLTANQYFQFCKVAYLANQARFPEMDEHDDGRAMYERWADGRHGGLVDIDGESEDALLKWYEGSARQGCHPWEIYRGGNSTHIDLSITREYGKWTIRLTALSVSRTVETVRIANTLAKHGVAFKWDHHDNICDRLLGQGLVGIVPQDQLGGYAWHNFPQEWSIADCVSVDWFRDPETNKFVIPKHAIARLSSWFPLEPSPLAS
jgi:hypothetical protein